MGILILQVEGGKLANRLREFPGKTLPYAHASLAVEVDIGDVVHVLRDRQRGLGQREGTPFTAKTELESEDAFAELVAPIRNIHHRHLANIEGNAFGLDIFLVDQPRLLRPRMDVRRILWAGGKGDAAQQVFVRGNPFNMVDAHERRLEIER